MWLPRASFAMTAAASSPCGTRPSSLLAPQAPRPAADARESRKDQVGGGLDIGPVGVPLARIDQEHLAGPNLASLGAIVEVQTPFGHDEGDRDRIAVRGPFLPRLEPQTDDAHRSTVRDLLKAKRTARLIRR